MKLFIEKQITSRRFRVRIVIVKDFGDVLLAIILYLAINIRAEIQRVKVMRHVLIKSIENKEVIVIRLFWGRRKLIMKIRDISIREMALVCQEKIDV